MKLHTQRLTLREVEATDVDAMFAWQVDPRYLEHWGHGYVTEALRRIGAFAVDEIGLDELNARTACTNARSIRVLERLGFSHALSLPPGTGRDGRFWP